jgi:hypothetical protein
VRKDRASLFRRGVVPGNCSEAFFTHRGILRSKCFRVNHFVNENIGALREMNEILRVSRVAGKHYGVSCKVDAVAQRWLDLTVVDCKRRHFDPGIVIHDALLDVLRLNVYAARRQFVVFLAIWISN